METTQLATVIKQEHTDMATDFLARLKDLLSRAPEVKSYSVSNDYTPTESLKLRQGKFSIEIRVAEVY